MKKLSIVIIILLSTCKSFSQKQYLYDSVMAYYDMLNNESFAQLQLEDTSGNLFNTATLSGKTIYVDFWFTACPPCIKEIPFSKELQQYFSKDTNVVFLSICIENLERKLAWKQMIKEKGMMGTHLFYARNHPQKINLLRKYHVIFPTYLLVNKNMKVIGYDAPRPSEKSFVTWAILKAEEGQNLSESYKQVLMHSKEYKKYLETFADSVSAEKSK